MWIKAARCTCLCGLALHLPKEQRNDPTSGGRRQWFKTFLGFVYVRMLTAEKRDSTVPQDCADPKNTRAIEEAKCVWGSGGDYGWGSSATRR